ncbi:hypothetical protein JNUCC0626_21910 [Lentzea sp. JNUCC 0626]|uniref:hypothetical protein n=1 Tax=Lentzea sp. JNUCC 0626 TaxID=3367513 RepID=UPI003747AEA3
MGVDLRAEERVLWQGNPTRRAVFVREDRRWTRFSLKFEGVKIGLLAASIVAGQGWADFFSGWPAALGTLAVLAALDLLFYFVEPFAWRRFTLHRTTYYVTDQRVVSTPGRRSRSTDLTEIGPLTFTEEPDGSGYVHLGGRVLPDGFGNRTVGELFHVADVHEVVTLLSTLTGQPASQR